MSGENVNILVFSDDITRRRAVTEGVGLRASADTPRITWTEAATAFGVRDAFDQGDFALLVLDAEAKKEGGMSIAQDLMETREDVPPVVLLTARPQDDWLAAWSKAEVVVPRPLDPMALQEGVTRALQARPGTVVPAG